MMKRMTIDATALWMVVPVASVRGADLLVAYVTDGKATYVMDAATHARLRQLHTGSSPLRITPSTDGKEVWVSDIRMQQLWQVDARQGQVIKRHRAYVPAFGAAGFGGRIIAASRMKEIVPVGMEPMIMPCFARDAWAAVADRGVRQVYLNIYHARGCIRIVPRGISTTTCW